MASLTVNVAGQWTATADIAGAGAQSLGLTADGYLVSALLHEQVLRRTDRYGSSRLEAFHQGMDMSLQTTFVEWKATELKLLTVPNQTITPSGSQVVKIGTIGAERTTNAAVMVLSSVASTPARNNSFTTVTLHAVTADEGFQMDWNLGPDKLVLPFRGIIWPVTDGAGGAKLMTTA